MEARLLLEKWRDEETSLIGRLVVFPSESGERSEVALSLTGVVSDSSEDSLRLVGRSGLNAESFELSISLTDASFLLTDAWKAPLPVRALAVRKFTASLVVILPYGYCRLYEPHK